MANDSFPTNTTGTIQRLDQAYCSKVLQAVRASGQPMKDQEVLQSTIIGMYAVILTFGACGSLLVIIVVLRRPAMRTARNLFIANLALSDFLMCSVTAPFTLYYVFDYFWSLGEITCRMVATLQGVNIFVSTFSIATISLDRFLVILFPTSTRLQEFALIASFGMVWLIAIGLALPMFVYTHLVHVQEIFHQKLEPGMAKTWTFYVQACDIRLFVCHEVWPSQKGRIIYTVFCFFLQYFIPLTTIMFIYSRIVSRLAKRRNVLNQSTLVERQHRFEAQQRRTTRLILSIVFIFAIVWLPSNIFIFLVTYDRKNWDVPSFAFCYMVGMFSACANPIIYGVFNENFRHEFRDIFCIERISAAFFRQKRTFQKEHLEISRRFNNGNLAVSPTSNAVEKEGLALTSKNHQSARNYNRLHDEHNLTSITADRSDNRNILDKTLCP